MNPVLAKTGMSFTTHGASSPSMRNSVNTMKGSPRSPTVRASLYSPRSMKGMNEFEKR